MTVKELTSFDVDAGVFEPSGDVVIRLGFNDEYAVTLECEEVVELVDRLTDAVVAIQNHLAKTRGELQ